MYSHQENAPPNTCNEDLHIEDDDTSLHLKALMGAFRGSVQEGDGKMSVEQASEYLWSLFIGQIH